MGRLTYSCNTCNQTEANEGQFLLQLEAICCMRLIPFRIMNSSFNQFAHLFFQNTVQRYQSMPGKRERGCVFILKTHFPPGRSLRMKPPLIRSRYCVRNAKRGRSLSSAFRTQQPERMGGGCIRRPAWANLDKHLQFVWLCFSSIKTATRRIMRLGEPSLKVCRLRFVQTSNASCAHLLTKDA